MKKEYLLRFAKIVFISREKEEYKYLKSFGFRNVKWFHNIQEAYAYFVKNKEALKEYDVFYEHSIRGLACFEMREMLFEYRNHILRVERYSDRFIKQDLDYFLLPIQETQNQLVYEKLEGVESPQKYIVGEDVAYFHEEEFVCKKILTHLERKKQVIPIKNLKILCVASFLGIDKYLFENFLQKRGLSVTFIDWYEEVINPDSYDIVLLKEGFVTNNSSWMKKDVFFCESFREAPASLEEENYPFSYELGEKITLTFTKDSYKEETSCFLLQKTAIEKLAIICMVAVENFARVMGVCLPDDFVTSCHYTQEYFNVQQKELEKEKKRLEPLETFEQFIELLEQFFSCRDKKHFPKDKNGIQLFKNEEYYYIENLYNGRVIGRLKIPFYQEKFLKVMEIQITNPKGYWGSFQKVGIYLEERTRKDTLPRKMIEAEAAMYSTILHKSTRILSSFLASLEEGQGVSRKRNRKK